MSRDPLDRRVLAQIARGVDAPPDDREFDALACELFHFQYEHVEPYRRICALAGGDPGAVRHWTHIPRVPTGAFKEARFASFPPRLDVCVFRTSGTTLSQRGALHLDTLELYQASLLASLEAHICPGGEKLPFLVLAPPHRDAPDSSLSYMYDIAAQQLGRGEPRFYVSGQGWRPEELIDDLRSVDGPVALVGTAFAFVHLIDALRARGARLALPEGTRVMETGGFKGRSRELSRDQLHAAISTQLGIPTWRIVNQYGMCELGSQFYEPSLRLGRVVRTKVAPPWVRTRALDPASGRDVLPGEVGALAHYDLTNTGSVLAIQTSDAGRMVEGGFEVLGRLQGAEARGCSIAADALLGGA